MWGKIDGLVFDETQLPHDHSHQDQTTNYNMECYSMASHDAKWT